MRSHLNIYPIDSLSLNILSMINFQISSSL